MRHWLILTLLLLPAVIAVTPTNPGDLNADLAVNILDVNLVVSCLGQNAATCQSGRADPNNDNTINLYDFLQVSRFWNADYSTPPYVESCGNTYCNATAGETCNTCSADCGACPNPCGNGNIDSGEQCDGANLNSGSCVTQGFTSGTLTCAATCTYNTSQCSSGGSITTYATYLPGSSEDVARDIYVDGAGNIYVAGGTKSSNFRTTAGAYDRTHNGNMDMFIMKFTPNGTLVFSTFIGGPNYDRVYGLEVDSQGYIYVAGRGGAGFPTTAGVVQPSFGGDVIGSTAYGLEDGAIAKLSPDGSQLIWATYIGSDDGGYFRDLDIDSSGIIYAIMAQVERPGHVITPGALQSTLPGVEDMYILKLSPDATSILYSTYLGGSAIDGYGPTVRALDNGEMYISSGVFSTDIPVSPNGYDTSQNGNQDFYVAKLSADLSTLQYGTFLGGSALEFSETHSIWVQNDGTILVASGTASSNFPTTPGAYDTTYNGGVTDAYVARFSSDLSTLLYSTFIGGNDVERVEGFNADANGNIFVGGTTASTNFPVTSNGADRTYGGGTSDAWIGRFSPDLSSLVYASYIGGSGLEEGRSHYGTTQYLYSVGQTDAANFPTTANALSRSAGGGKDAYLVITSLP